MNLLAGNRIPGAMVAAAVSIAGLSGSRAEAAFIVTNSGAALTHTDEYVATSASTYSSSTSGSDYLLDVPGQYSVTNNFSATQTSVLGTSPVGNYAFQDSYVFQVGKSADGDVLTAALNLPGTFALSNLQFRLYEITAGTTTPVVGGTLAGNPSVVSVESAWQGHAGADSSTISASFTGLQTTGTYVLDIAGTATGANGGLYVGSLNLQPVPLPAAIWFMLSGLGGIGLMARRRNAA